MTAGPPAARLFSQPPAARRLRLARDDISREEYQRRYDVIARYHVDFHLANGRNPWMEQEPELRAWTVGRIRGWVPDGARLLDAGCGIGHMLGELSAVYDAHGIDIAEPYLQYARSRGLHVTNSWLEDIPFDAGEFDAVVCCDALEHVLSPEKAVAEFRRVAKPGGILVVRVPNGEATGVGNDGGFGFPVHLQQWDAEQLQEFLGGEPLGSEVWQDELVMAVRL